MASVQYLIMTNHFNIIWIFCFALIWSNECLAQVPLFHTVVYTNDNITSASVGDALSLHCEVTTFSEVEPSSIMFRWTGPDRSTVISDDRILSTNTSVNNTQTSSIQFTYLMEGDEGRYTCRVTVLSVVQSRIVTLGTLAIPTPNVTVTVPSIQSVGQSLTLECSVTTVRGITTRVDIMWSSDGIELEWMEEVNVNFVTNSSVVYTDTYTISQLTTIDDGREYQCEVVIHTSPPVMANGSITLDVTISTPYVTITAPDIQTVGQSLTLECSATDMRGITSTADIIWSSDNVILMRRNKTSPIMTDSGLLLYADTYSISQLNTTDDGREYQCEVVIHTSPLVMATGNITLDVMVPIPSVNIAASKNQTVGRSLTLECNVTTMQDITGVVDIVWSKPRDGVVLTTRDLTTLPPIYTDIYIISQLTTTDDGREYQCEVVINTSPPVVANDSVTLHVIVPPFHLAISPNDTSQLYEVGNSLNLDCSVTTVSGVDPSSIMFSWVGPHGNTVTRNDRVLNPTISDHTDSIEFTYLMEGDNGTYTCNVMILGTNGSVSVVLALAVPTPSVTITLPNTQIVGHSLTLECNVITVRGVTSRVDIIWSSDGIELKVIEGVNINSTTDNSIVYTDTYTIPKLSTTDNGTMYHCEVMINTSPPVMANDSVALDVISTACDEATDDWGINWLPQTPGLLESRPCPNGSSGEAYRRCLPDGVWDLLINIAQCRHLVFTYLLERVNELLHSPSSVVDALNQLQGISGELVHVSSIEVFFPNDLNTTIGIIDTITRFTQKASEILNENDTTNIDRIFDNVATTVSSLLSDTKSVTFRESQNAGLPSIGEDFLRTIENFAVAVGNVTSATNESRILPRDNIIIEAQLVPKNTTLIKTIVFPNDTMSEKFNRTQITIPRSALIHQRQTENASVPVVNFVAKNLQLNTSNYSLSNSGVVISSQISQGPIDLTDSASQVTLKFKLGNTAKSQCVYWKFNHESQSNQSTGGWSSDGIVQDNDHRPPVICRATHLTSFSVLVSSDAATNSPELHIVSYVGCGVSIVCLLLTIGAIILLRNTVFKGKHHMLHLNLSIALLAGLIVFVSGVETAVNSRGWCTVVATLLHYFFLCVFCWTLCEAILIYIKFAWIHYEGIFQDMRFFLILGWGLPIPVVAISAGISHEYYAIHEDGNTAKAVIACWISYENGSIWAFVAPVILILLINMILFTFSMWKIFRSAGGKMAQAVKEKYETAKILLLGIIVLLPLLGATWLLGLLLLIDNESVVVAWVFTIINSLQGLGIFFLHIVRSRELRNFIRDKIQKWRIERKLKSSSTKDTTMQGQTWNSDNWLLQNQN